MEIIQPYSTLNETPTSQQIRAITKLCTILHIQSPLEEQVQTRKEARDIIYQLLLQVKSKRGIR